MTYILLRFPPPPASSMILRCLDVIFFQFILLDFIQSVNLCLSPNLESLKTLFLQLFFYMNQLLLFFCDSSDMGDSVS